METLIRPKIDETFELEKLLNLIIENKRDNMVHIIHQHSDVELTKAQVWNLAYEPKYQLRKRVAEIILKKLKNLE